MLTDAQQIQLNVRLNKCVSYVKHFILTCGTATAEFQTTGVQAPDCQAALSEKVRQQIATGLQIQSQTLGQHECTESLDEIIIESEVCKDDDVATE